MQIKRRTGESEPFQLAKLQRVLDEAARGLPGVDVDAVAVDVEVGLYDGMASKGLADLLLDVALSHVGDDPDRLADALRPERDLAFRFNGLFALQERYLVRDLFANEVLEAPQFFWMRVAMGVSLEERDPTQQELAFY